MQNFPEVRDLLLDADGLIRAVGSGAQREVEVPWRRAEVRYVDLTAGRRLQVELFDERQAFTKNHDDAEAALDELLAIGFANWHVETTVETVQVRVNRKGKVLVNRSKRAASAEVDRSHDRSKRRLLSSDLRVFRALGLTDAEGRIKPSRQAKFRQIEEFVRALSTVVDDAVKAGRLRRPTAEEPWRVADLGCGNAYLTFAAQAWLAQEGLPAVVTGVDVKEQSKQHNAEVAAELGVADAMSFVVGAIGEVELESPDIVLALHACDTATDDALAQAVGWESAVVLAAPCCHHDIAAQIREVGAPEPYSLLVRDGIVRERLADTLTDALRAGLLRSVGYRVDVVEFIESAHTPRNSLIRAVRTGQPASRAEYDALVEQWHLRPKLGELLGS
ncbi:MAG: class I SAM-dependent methyltransferase [Marmoricola sp.]